MAQIQTYPRKTTYDANDLILICDKTPDANGVVTNDTKTTTISTIADNLNVVETLNSLKGNINITGGTNITVTPSGQNIEISTSASNVDGSGTANTIPKWSDSNTLTDSPFTIDTSTNSLDIPSYIRHIGDIDSLFGFSNNDDFIINVNSGTDQIRVRQNSIIISTDSGTKLAAGPSGVVLYNDENGSTTVSKESLLTYDSGIIVKGGTENSFARGGAVRFYTSTNDGYVGIKGPTTSGTNYEIILPNAVGTADQVLKLPSTIGSTPYQLAWGDAGSGGGSYTAGDGLDLTGTTFSTDLKANGGLVIESTELAVDLSASAITGTLGIVDGGTGLSLSATGTFDALMGNGGASFEQSGNKDTALKLPVGATNRRPTASEDNVGLIRYNSETANFEVCKQTTQSSEVYAWYTISGLTIINP